MIKWWKRRKEIKRIKAIKDTLEQAQEAIETIRDLTPIGDLTSNHSSSSSSNISRINLTQMCIDIFQIIDAIDKEVDDRTRERKSLFTEDKKRKKDAIPISEQLVKEFRDDSRISYAEINRQIRQMQEEGEC